MAYPTPNEQFNTYYLSNEIDNGNGTFTFTVGQASYSNVVYDNIKDSPSDSNAQIGDVSGDQFHEVASNGPNASTGTFIGGTSAHQTFVGQNTAVNGFYLYTNNAYALNSKITVNSSTAFATSTICYASGTLIRTIRGDIAVEHLVVGDIVITGSGGRRPIRWLGHHTFDCRGHAEPMKVWPVRIAAHAFATNKPSRNLYVSPEHSLCVDVVGGVLIPAQNLVNGVVIDYAETDMVTYWHVELDGHDTLLAENMAAESYLEMGENRHFFTANDCVEASAIALARTHADFCLPFIDKGPVWELVKHSLEKRAKQLGWTPLDDEALFDLNKHVA